MKKLTLVLAAATALVSAPTLAADLGRMPVRAPVAAPAPFYNWSGFYLGVQGGGAFGDLDWAYATGLPGGSSAPLLGGTTANHTTSGGLLGGTIGFNWQAGTWVFGLEGDYAWANITGTTACPNPAFNCQSRLDSFGTARGRIGWSWGPGMIYGTGGAAFGDQNIRTVNIAGLAIPPSGTPRNGSSEFAVGWTAGAGIEFAFAPNWSAKVEALYFDLGTDRYTVDNGLLVDARHSGVVVRGGINYRFNWGGPVVASY
jgi:outer membrane immunogenic protein